MSIILLCSDKGDFAAIAGSRRKIDHCQFHDNHSTIWLAATLCVTAHFTSRSPAPNLSRVVFWSLTAVTVSSLSPLISQH